MKIIVLQTTNYKEKDSIINAISDTEYLTFNAHGVLSPTSKNASINNVLTVADVVLSESKTHKWSLKESSVIDSPFLLNKDINYLSTISLLAEATNEMLSDDEKPLAFPYLMQAISKLKTCKEPLYIAISYLCKMLKLSGYSLEINRCVRCGKKTNIKTFSFIEGGFICADCLEEGDSHEFDNSQMLMIRSLAGSATFDFTNVSYDRNDTLFILRRLIEFIEDGCGVKIDSARLITNY